MGASNSVLGHLPRNTRIAAALLEVLGTSGDVGGRARALRAAGLEAASLRSSITWLPEATLREMFRAAAVDRRLGRRVGQALVRPEGVGLALCYSGLATPEKAYRRSQQLLARESEAARFELVEIAGESGRIVFHPGPGTRRRQSGVTAGERAEARTDEGLCGVREGMLEAVPMLFGLLPARVTESECVARGADRCVFDIRWRRLPRTGLWIGLAGGVVLGGTLAAALLSAGPAGPAWPAWIAGLAGCSVLLLAAGAGRAVDLARQLEAVAGARRGQLALLDQADQSLAEKLDSLARLGGDAARSSLRPSVVEGPQGLVPVARPRPAGVGDSGEPGAAAGLESARRAAAGIRESLAGLRQRMADLEDRLREEPSVPQQVFEPLFLDCLLESRRIEEALDELARQVGPADGARARRDLAPILERAVASLQRQLAATRTIELDLAPAVPAVVCDAGQIEWLVEQLLRNAIAATAGEAGGEARGAVRVSLSHTPDGVELAVSDEGEGIEEHTVDEVFDPFFGGAVAGRDLPLGLPVCYRIVAAHGGELRVVGQAGRGTRVAALLPPAPHGA